MDKVEIIRKLCETNDPCPKAFFRAKILKFYKGSTASFDGHPEFLPGDQYILLLGKHTNKENTFGIYGADSHPYQIFKMNNKAYTVKLSMQDRWLMDIGKNGDIKKEVQKVLKGRAGMQGYEPEPYIFTLEDFENRLNDFIILHSHFVWDFLLR